MTDGSRLENRVPYSGEQEVTPTASVPNDYLSLRANPEGFGANIGEAIQGVGKSIGQIGDTVTNYMVKRQGLINEAAFTQADSDYQVQSGKVMDEYRNLPASEQINKTDEYVDKLLKVRNDLRAGLPNDMSRKGFDQLTMRSQGYMIRDLGTVAAGAHKTLFKQAATASIGVSIDGASRPEIAFDDNRFNDQVANIKFQIPSILAIDDEDITKLGAKVDPKTGDVTFPDTPEGNQAKAIYQYNVNEAIDKAWTNRIETIRDDPQRGSPILADQMLQSHKSEMPAKTYAKLSHELFSAVRNEQTRNFSDTYMGHVNGDYQKSATNPDASVYPTFDENRATQALNKLFPGTQITSTGRSVEENKKVGGVSDSQHLETVPGDKNSGSAMDFAVPVGADGKKLNMNEIRAHFKQEGLPVSELIPEKGPHQVASTEEADHIHWGWKPKGSEQAKGNQPPTFTSSEQYLLQHRSDIIEDAVTQAGNQNPNWGATELDTVRSRVTQHVDQQITQMQGADRADKQLLVQYAVKNNLTNLDDLSHATPDVQKAYERQLANDSYFVYNFQNKLITANSKGQSQYYGTEYYDILTKAMNGQINNVSQLPDVGYGKNAVLTNTGLKSILQAMQSSSTPEGKAFNISEVEFLKRARGLVSATGIAPGLKTQELDEDFAKWVQWAMPKIEAGRAAGKSPDQLFDEKSPDFIGWPKATDPMKVMKEVMNHRFNALSEQKNEPKKPAPINSLQSLMQARRSNQINDDQFRHIAGQHKDWFKTEAAPSKEGPNPFNG